LDISPEDFTLATDIIAKAIRGKAGYDVAEKYAVDRLLRTANDILTQAYDPSRTLVLLRESGLYQYFLKTDPKGLGTLMSYLEKKLFSEKNQGFSFHPWRRHRVKANRIGEIPDGSIMEGTFLYGGKRGSLIINKENPAFLEFVEALKEEIPRSWSQERKILAIRDRINQSAGPANIRPGLIMDSCQFP